VISKILERLRVVGPTVHSCCVVGPKISSLFMDNWTQLDSLWENLPCALSERICNTLPQVRKVDANLKRDIEDWGEFLEVKRGVGSIDMFFTFLNVMNEENGPVFIRPGVGINMLLLYSLWCQLNAEERARCLEIFETTT
jgi:hypothetical protein